MMVAVLMVVQVSHYAIHICMSASDMQIRMASWVSVNRVFLVDLCVWLRLYYITVHQTKHEPWLCGITFPWSDLVSSADVMMICPLVVCVWFQDKQDINLSNTIIPSEHESL